MLVFRRLCESNRSKEQKENPKYCIIVTINDGIIEMNRQTSNVAIGLKAQQKSQTLIPNNVEIQFTNENNVEWSTPKAFHFEYFIVVLYVSHS